MFGVPVSVLRGRYLGMALALLCLLLYGTAQAELVSPTLTAPANGAVNVVRPVHLAWGAVSGAASYHVQIATTDGFTTIAVGRDGITTTSVDITGLYANTHYFWRVRGIESTAAGVIPGAWSAVWSFTTAAETPALPAPTLLAPENGAINLARPVTLSWTAVTGATRYHVQVATTDGFTTLVAGSVNVTATTIPVAGLLANTRYFWRVRGLVVSDAGAIVSAGAWSAIRNFTTAAEISPLPAPTLLTPANGATGVTRPVHLSWTAVTGAARYHIQLATVEGFTSIAYGTDNVTTTSVDVPGLLANTRYFWRVRAIPAAVNATVTPGVWSAVWSFTIAAETPALPAPTLLAPANGATNLARPVTLSWTAVTGATRYHVQVATTDGFTTLVAGSVNVTATTIPVAGLLANTHYFWRVRGLKISETGAIIAAGAWSAIWSFTTAPETTILPAPTLLTPANGATGVARPVHLSWSAATGAARYHVQLATVEGFTTIAVGTDNVTATSLDVTGLLANTRYFWRVRAIPASVNGAVPTPGAWSVVWSFTTATETPALPAPTLLAPANGATNLARPVQLSWTAVTGAMRYHVQVATTDGFTTLVAGSVNVAATTIPVAGLLANTHYFWRVRGLKISETGAIIATGAWSAIWNFTTAPETPALTAPTPVAPANGATNVARPVHLYWTAVTGAVRYQVQVATTDSFATIAFGTDSPTITTVDATGLLANTHYFWRVRALGSGTPAPAGAWSVVWSFTTVAETTVLPAPTPLTPANGATGVTRPVHLSWTAVTGAVRYHVQVATTEGLTNIVFANENVTATAVDVTGLLANTHYFWRVRAIPAAVNATVTPGAWSAVWSFTTAAETTTLPAPVQSTPSDGATGVVRPVQLSWSAVDGAVRYHLQISTTEGFTTIAFGTDAPTVPTATVSTLAAGTQYFWRVRAIPASVNGAAPVPGAWSTVWSFTTAAAQ